MSRWTKQFDEHPIHETAKTLREHLNVEFDGKDENWFFEKRRLDQFVIKLTKTLDLLDAEGIPFNHLDHLHGLLASQVVRQTEHFSTSGSIDYLHQANEYLHEPLVELAVLRSTTSRLRKSVKLTK